MNKSKKIKIKLVHAVNYDATISVNGKEYVLSEGDEVEI